MSLLNLLLARKEILLSIAAIVLILIVVMILAIAPELRVYWKKRMARKQAQKAARIARLKKNQNRNKPQRGNGKAAPRRRSAEAASAQKAPPAEAVPAPIDEAPSIAAVEAAAAPTRVSEAPSAPTAEPATAVGENTSAEVSSSLQDMLNSVFVNEEANSRYGVLLKGVEPVSAEALVALASTVAQQLGILEEQGKPS